MPRLSIARPLHFPHHRSGWEYVMRSLQPLLGEGGVTLDLFIEESFCWNVAKYEEAGMLPYRSPWVGFVHNPPGIPVWHEWDSAPQNIFQTPAWRASQPQCRGLFTFSRAMAKWLSSRVEAPVEALVHPTEAPERKFSPDRFLELGRPRIVQVGAWLRRINSIARLPVARRRKTCLIPRQDGSAYLQSLIEREQRNDPQARGADWSRVETIHYLDARGFDDLLSDSIVFLDLYDSVVNNTVVECIVRGTPLVCNRLPALVELLGADYPLYFSSLEEAAAKADDAGLIARGAAHLRAIPKDRFTGEYFARSVVESQIYRSLAEFDG